LTPRSCFSWAIFAFQASISAATFVFSAFQWLVTSLLTTIALSLTLILSAPVMAANGAVATVRPTGLSENATSARATRKLNRQIDWALE
jgi:hypothetical protein